MPKKYRVYKGIKRDIKAFGIPIEYIKDFIPIALVGCFIPFVVFKLSIISFVIAIINFILIQRHFKKKHRENSLHHGVLKGLLKKNKAKKITVIKSSTLKPIKYDSFFNKR